MSTASSPTRSRNASLHANALPSVSHMLRSTKSSTNVRPQLHRIDTGDSLDLPAERERKQSGRFMGMLRKKSSAIAVNLSEVLHNQDASPSKSSLSSASAAKSGAKPKMSPRSATSQPDEGRSSKRKKDKKRETLPPDLPPLPSGHTGVSLDTNLDEMDGIVNLDNLQTFPKAYSVAGAAPYDHFNAVTGNSSPRPGTPPSPSQLHGLRRPSLAISTRYEFLPSDVPDLSPMGKRLGLSRRDSVDLMSTMNGWSGNMALGSVAVTPDVPAISASRKASIVSLVNDRRGSEGTVNGGPTLPDSGWTAPDSWAVKAGDLKGDDDSDEEFGRPEKSTGLSGSATGTPILGGNADTGPDTVLSNGRVQSNARRPGTGNSMAMKPSVAMVCNSKRSASRS